MVEEVRGWTDHRRKMKEKKGEQKKEGDKGKEENDSLSSFQLEPVKQ